MSRASASSSAVRRGRGALVAFAASLLLLPGCAPEPAPEPEVLSATAAGRAYLDAVCPVNEAWGEVDVAVDELRIAVARSGADAGTAQLREAVDRLDETVDAAVEQLGSKKRTWPTGARDEIEGVRDSLRADAKQLAELRKLPADEAASYAWAPGDAAEAGAAARAALQLPDDAEAACVQWAEQRGSGSADADPAEGSKDPSEAPPGDAAE